LSDSRDIISQADGQFIRHLSHSDSTYCGLCPVNCYCTCCLSTDPNNRWNTRNLLEFISWWG